MRFAYSRRQLLSFALAGVLAGCGGSAAALPRATTSVVAVPQQPQLADMRASVFDRSAFDGTVRELLLDDRAEVPGTGVSMRVPQGAERTAIGAGGGAAVGAVG